MRSFLFFLTIPFLTMSAFAQQEQANFEGTLVYKVSVQSKSRILTVSDVRKMLVKGDTYSITARDGNYRETTEFVDVYTLLKDKRSYFKFRKLDTLYYMDFSSDTSRVLGFDKKDSAIRIDGYPCKIFNVRTGSVAKKYYYTSSLHMDPRLSEENMLDHWNLFTRETGGGFYLWSQVDYRFALETDSCIRVEKNKVDDHIFDPPNLPKKKFVATELFIGAHFPGKNGDWLKYLQKNLNGDLAAKYVKITKSQQEASQVVLVEFVVSEDGSLSNFQVVNKDQVNAHLSEEALRVIQASPRWAPATFIGEKLTSSVRQPVVFKVER